MWWAREGLNCGSRPALPAAPAFTSVPSWHSSPPNPAFSCHHFLTCVNIVAGYTHRFGSTVMWRRSSNRLRSTRTFNVKSLFRWNLFRWWFRCLQPVSYIWSSSADMKYECDFWERRIQTKLGNSVENVQKHGRTQVAVTVVFSETIASAKDWEKRPTCFEASGEDHLFLKRFEEMSLQDVRRKCVSIDLEQSYRTRPNKFNFVHPRSRLSSSNSDKLHRFDSFYNWQFRRYSALKFSLYWKIEHIGEGFLGRTSKWYREVFSK